jgi:hypothetical protein
MSSTPTNIDLLKIDFRTLFILNTNDRILDENEPIPSEGPQFWLARCSEGQVYGFHVDVNDKTIDRIKHLIASDPTTPDEPGHRNNLHDYLTLLRRGQSDPDYNFGLIYHLPHSLSYVTPSNLVFSNLDDGKALLHSWQTSGMPKSLLDLGFNSTADIWPPWCAAIVGDEVASLAFCARLSDEGAELGLVTVKEFRGRGLAAAVTAGWARHPELEGRELFYSMDARNEGSKRVAERLGLRQVGLSLRIY